MDIYLSSSDILLTNRTFRVRVGDTLSPFFDQAEGVSQGSVLSVLRFVLAINDIVASVPDGISCSLYVNDFFFIFEWLDLAVCSPSDAVGDQ